jgi:hypothetical protein
MSRRGIRRGLYGLAVLLCLLHQDFWFRGDARRILGLPVGLTYHVLYCVAAAGLMVLLVRYAWPRHLEPDDHRSDPT